MATYVTCPACATRLHVPETLVGKKVQCPKCENLFPVPEVTFAPADAPAPVMDLEEHESVGSTKIAAGICGILLGSLGIHKFILGMTTPGLIMLLVSILTCGIGAIVMHLIGLIEGIIYLTKSDEEFYRLYMVEKRGWF